VVTGLAVVVAASTIGCTSNDAQADPTDRSVGVYAGIMRWLAASRTDDPEPLPVFVEPRGEGATIPLEVQAALLTAAEPDAEPRFIDVRDEALVTADDGTISIADDGMLVRLPPVDEMSDPVFAEVDVFADNDTFITLRFELRPRGDGWSVVGNPEQVGTVSGDDAGLGD
jgi:hypothetical protein